MARGKLVDGAAPRVDEVQVIFHQAPSLDSTLHFGSRLVWRRDGTLFITMGDRSITEGRMQAQRMDGLLGKIARINADGSIPKDNPFVGKDGVPPAMWSLGHRNIQSAALHPATGEFWEVEHGTRGGDEINIARKGKDYGWPTIAYGIEYRGGPITGGIQHQAGMEQPLYYWDPIIGPSGMAFYTADRCSRRGRAACSSAATAAATWCASRSTARRSPAKSACWPTRRTRSATCGRGPTGRSTC